MLFFSQLLLLTFATLIIAVQMMPSIILVGLFTFCQQCSVYGVMIDDEDLSFNFF
jgi:hypothetical protein